MFCMLVFAFFAIAGLAIDIGMASLSQQEMQVATDTAALEGLRMRNSGTQIDTSDLYRRQKAGQQVRLTFDDDLQPTGNAWAINDPQDNPAEYDDEDHLHLGAGPGFQVPGHVGDQHIVTSSVASIWDDPVLRYNRPNKQYGDMVSGTYNAHAVHAEYGDTYQRPDFAAGIMGSGSNASQFHGLGFLVRMRRTSGISASGGQNPFDTEPDVSYRARPVPYLFSLGSLIQGNGSAADPRESGITVRATTIAVARPALRASPPPLGPDGTTVIPDEAYFPPVLDENGLPNPAHLPMMGLYPFAVSLDFWVSRVIANPALIDPSLPIEAQTWHQPAWFKAEPDGTLIQIEEDGTIVLDTNGQPLVAGHFAQYGTSVGQAVQQAPRSELAQVNGYVAIYADIPGPTGLVSRVIGYGFCTASRDADVVPAPDETILFRSGIMNWGTAGDMSPVQAWLAPNGVSARLDSHAPALSAPEWTEVFDKNRFLVYGPWTDTQGTVTGGEVSYDYHMVRHGSVFAAALAR